MVYIEHVAGGRYFERWRAANIWSGVLGPPQGRVHNLSNTERRTQRPAPRLMTHSPQQQGTTFPTHLTFKQPGNGFYNTSNTFKLLRKDQVQHQQK